MVESELDPLNFLKLPESFELVASAQSLGYNHKLAIWIFPTNINPLLPTDIQTAQKAWET